MAGTRTKRERPPLRTGNSSARYKRRQVKYHAAKNGFRRRVRAIPGSHIARRERERVEQKPAEPRTLPRWGAVLVAPAVAGILAWAFLGVATPSGLADLLKAGPSLAAMLCAIVGVVTFGLEATPILQVKHRVEVLFHRTASWLPGETQKKRDARMRGTGIAAPDECYPDLHPGRVTSVRRVSDIVDKGLPSLLHMSDKDRPVAVLELTDAQISRLSCKRSKIVLAESSEARAAPLTLDDRHGAILPDLVAKYGSRRAVEVAEQTADIEEQEALLNPGVAHEKHTFTLDVERLRKALPRTVTHTGTGLYWTKVTPTKHDDQVAGMAGQVVTLNIGGLGSASAFIGGYAKNTDVGNEIRAIVSHTDGTITVEGDISGWLDSSALEIYDGWSTIQGAVDQLFTDQAANAFTVEQRIEIYDGTYDEIVTLAGTMLPQASIRLVIAAATGQTGVIITNASTSGHTVQTSTVEYVSLTGIEIRSVQAARASILPQAVGLRVESCVLDGQSTGATGILSGNSGVNYTVWDTTVKNFLTYGLFTFGTLVVRRCVFENNTSHIASFRCVPVDASGSTFEGGTRGLWLTGAAQSTLQNRMLLRQNTFYGVTYPYDDASAVNNRIFRLEARNNIFQGATNVYNGNIEGGWLEMDNNSYFNNTAIADTYQGVTRTTLADWQAITDDFSVSPDANAISADPLMTDPGNGDFSLQAASPARHAGRGSGVVSDVDGTAYDVHHPDIGAASSGTLTVSEPTLISATDQVDGDSVEVDVTAANALDTIYAYYKTSSDATWTQWATPRTGSGTITITGLTDGQLYLFEARPFRFIWGESSTVLTANVTSAGLSASGAVSLPLENVRTLLANSGTYQTLVGAIDANAAKPFIHYPAKATPWTLPRAVLNHTEPSPTHTLIARGKGNGFSEAGEVEVKIEAAIGASYEDAGSEENAFLEFGNKLGAIMQEMGALAGTTTYLDAQEFETTELVRSSHTKEAVETFYYRGVITIRWGGG